MTPFSLGKSRALWFCHSLPRTSSPGDYSVFSLSVASWNHLQGAPVGLLFQGVQGIHRPVFIYTGYPHGYSHSCKTHHPSLSMVINCDVVNKDQTFVTYISTPIYHSLVVLISLFPSRDMYHLSRGIKEGCPTFSPLSIACFPWRSCPDTTILSKDYFNQSL